MPNTFFRSVSLSLIVSLVAPHFAWAGTKRRSELLCPHVSTASLTAETQNVKEFVEETERLRNQIKRWMSGRDSLVKYHENVRTNAAFEAYRFFKNGRAHHVADYLLTSYAASTTMAYYDLKFLIELRGKLVEALADPEKALQALKTDEAYLQTLRDFGLDTSGIERILRRGDVNAFKARIQLELSLTTEPILKTGRDLLRLRDRYEAGMGVIFRQANGAAPPAALVAPGADADAEARAAKAIEDVALADAKRAVLERSLAAPDENETADAPRNVDQPVFRESGRTYQETAQEILKIIKSDVALKRYFANLGLSEVTLPTAQEIRALLLTFDEFYLYELRWQKSEEFWAWIREIDFAQIARDKTLKIAEKLGVNPAKINEIIQRLNNLIKIRNLSQKVNLVMLSRAPNIKERLEYLDTLNAGTNNGVYITFARTAGLRDEWMEFKKAAEDMGNPIQIKLMQDAEAAAANLDPISPGSLEASIPLVNTLVFILSIIGGGAGVAVYHKHKKKKEDAGDKDVAGDKNKADKPADDANSGDRTADGDSSLDEDVKKEKDADKRIDAIDSLRVKPKKSLKNILKEKAEEKKKPGLFEE